MRSLTMRPISLRSAQGTYRNHAVAVKFFGNVNVFTEAQLASGMTFKPKRQEASSDEEEEEEEEDQSDLIYEMRRFKQECLFMKELKHANIVMLIGAVWQENLQCAVMELVAGGNLQDFLNSREDLTWPAHKLKIAQGIARGMNYLHSSVVFDNDSNSYQDGVVHRDLKPACILLSEDAEAKVSGFGESRIVQTDATMTITGGSPYFMAPEIYRGDRYDNKVDVFSYGIILAEICQLGSIENLLREVFLDRNCGKRKKKGKIIDLFQRGALRPDFKLSSQTSVPGAMMQLMEVCWSHDPEKRPTFDEIGKRLGGSKVYTNSLLDAVAVTARAKSSTANLLAAGHDAEHVQELMKLKIEHTIAEAARDKELELERQRSQARLRQRMDEQRLKKKALLKEKLAKVEE